MERKRAILPLGLVAAGSLALAVTDRSGGTALAGLLSFPFRPLGRLLRWMSLSGGAGNAAAVGLFGLICLLPAVWLAARLVRRAARWEDVLLPVMSGAAFAALYWAINPGRVPANLGPIGPAFGGGVFWTLAAAYLALRLLRGCLAAEGGGLRRYARGMLWALAAVAVYGAFGASPGGLLNAVDAVRAGNTDASALEPTYVFLTLRYAVSAAAYILDLLAVFAGMGLLAAWEAGPYSEAAVAAAGVLSRRCALALLFSAAAGAVLAAAQLLFIKTLRTASVTVSVPLLPMGLVLAALLLAQAMGEGKALKDDNDLFI